MWTGLALIAAGLGLFYTARANYEDGVRWVPRWYAAAGTGFGLLLGTAAIVVGVPMLVRG
jgi:hypothetical protein